MFAQEHKDFFQAAGEAVLNALGYPVVLLPPGLPQALIWHIFLCNSFQRHHQWILVFAKKIKSFCKPDHGSVPKIPFLVVPKILVLPALQYLGGQ